MMSRSVLLMPISTVVMLGGIAGFLLDPTDPMIRFASWLFALLVIGMTGWAISDQPGLDPVDVRILDAVALAVAFMALCALALGSFGLLGWWMLVASAGMAGSMWAMIERRSAFERRRGVSSPLRVGFLSALAVALGVFAVVQAVLGRVFRPPVGDPLAYHLPFAVEWLQRGTLDMPIPPAGDPSPPFYPLNSSVWIYWMLAPFENEILARFVQLPFLLLLGLAVYRLALDLDLSTHAAAMTAALTVSVPAIARSASLPENDLILAALLVVATTYVVRLGKRFTVWRAAMAAAAIGLAVGTKVIALGPGAVLGFIWIILVIRGRRADGFWPALRVLFAGAIVVVLLGGYSYLRNAIMMENPLYPAGYELPGGYTLDGLYFPTWEWRQQHAFFPFDWDAFLNGSRRDFGWTVTAWGLPGLALAALVSLLGMLLPSRSKRDVAGLIPVIWSGVGMAIFWYVIPYHFTRFLFPTIIMAVVAGMWGLGRLAGRIRIGGIERWYSLLALPVIAINLINIPIDPDIRERAIYWLAAGIVVGGGTAMLIGLRWIAVRWLRLSIQAGAMAVMLIAMIGWPFYQDEYDGRRLDEWRAQIQGFSTTPDAWEWIEGETSGDDAVIAVAGTNEVYPFYGPRLDNRLVTIWSSGELAGYGWYESFSLYGEPAQEDWRVRIDEEDVDYIVVTEDVSFGGWPVEREWMRASPERFKLAFANDEIEVWAATDPTAESARYTVRQARNIQSDWHAH